MLPRPIEQLTAADIQELLQGNLRESRTLDFKRDAIGRSDDDKREFLADVSAFANTIGGDLLLGVDEAQGIASALPGITLADVDAEVLRLENILRSGVEPRIPKVDFKWIPLNGNTGILIVRVPRSWTAPHRVIFRDAKFYARSSAGKHPLDVSELREAFLASEALPERLRRFRTQRISIIESGEGALPLNDGVKLVLHLIPQSAFTNPLNLPYSDQAMFRPLGATGWNWLHTLEGWATYSGPEDAVGPVRAYTMTFRNGIIEAAARVAEVRDGNRNVSLERIESMTSDFLRNSVPQLSTLGLEPPYYFLLSLCGTRGYTAGGGNHWPPTPIRPVSRDMIFLPEMTIEQPNVTPQLIGPIFDLLWNSFGMPGSPNVASREN